MGHLGDGALRRMIDEPLASAEADRRHLEGCSPCQERKARIAGEADTASLLLAIPSFEPDTAAALARVHNLAEVAPAPRRAWARWSWKAPRLARPLVLALALVTVVGGGSAALSQGLTTIANPNQGVKTVTVSPPSEGSVAELPDLSKYGTTRVIKQGTTQTVLTADEATRLTGLTPPSVPAQYNTGTVTYTVVGQSVVSFTFNEAMAKQAAADAGKPAPVFPKGIDGSTITVTVGPAVGEVFGVVDPKNISLANLPLVAGVATPPLVQSTGVTYQQLEDFLVQQPGIAGNADLVAQIKAIGDPLASGSLVIPVPAKYATSTPETVNGNSGVLIADNTGMVKGLVWEQDKLIYAVGGHFDEQQLLGIANGTS